MRLFLFVIEAASITHGALRAGMALASARREGLPRSFGKKSLQATRNKGRVPWNLACPSEGGRQCGEIRYRITGQTLDVAGFSPGRAGLAVERAVFAQVAIDDFGAVCWPGGFSIAAQALHDYLDRTLSVPIERFPPSPSHARMNATQRREIGRKTER